MNSTFPTSKEFKKILLPLSNVISLIIAEIIIPFWFSWFFPYSIMIWFLLIIVGMYVIIVTYSLIKCKKKNIFLANKFNNTLIHTSFRKFYTENNIVLMVLLLLQVVVLFSFLCHHHYYKVEPMVMMMLLLMTIMLLMMIRHHPKKIHVWIKIISVGNFVQLDICPQCPNNFSQMSNWT
jgi:hypothetical protein